MPQTQDFFFWLQPYKNAKMWRVAALLWLLDRFVEKNLSGLEISEANLISIGNTAKQGVLFWCRLQKRVLE